MIDALEVRVAMLQYLRYKRQMPLVACECSTMGDRADILAVDKKGFLWNVEIKVSLADLKNDHKKNTHKHINQIRGNGNGDMPANLYELRSSLPARFYFALPYELKDAVLPTVSDLYPYAGVFFVAAVNHVMAYRRADELHSQVLGVHETWELTKEQSGTLVRVMTENLRLRQR